MSSSTRAAELEYESGTEPGPMVPSETIFRMRQSVLDGLPWFEALLEAVGRWRLPEETFAGRTYKYLYGGEAFDWLLLAERLLEEMADLVPPAEVEALLFHGRWPQEMPDDDFAERIGAAKHSAHLNYLYGVMVEEALQLFVEEEIHKELRANVWGQDARIDQTMYERIYGKPPIELRAACYEETGTLLKDHLTCTERQEWTYWLFKYRLKRQDPARIASDTRKGLAQLSRMELAVAAKRRGGKLDEAGFAARFPAQETRSSARA